ncbi:MAG: type II toxin-antitoxin system VapC family toxin [Acidimicrobiales bacterium]
MTLVLDSGGISMLVENRARLEELRRRGEWPALVPAVVLTEALTGDHRRDFQQNRLLRSCDICPTDEILARRAAALRTAVGRARAPSAVDAIVVALADDVGGATVLTGDLRDLRALAQHAVNDVRVAAPEHAAPEH